jgi:hypothetical protein
MKQCAPYFLLTLFLCAGLSSSSLFAQGLPAGLSVSQDGKRLIFGNKRVTGFYDTASIKEVRLYFTQADYWQQLINNYRTSSDLLGKMVYEGKTYDSVGIAFKGQTSFNRLTSTQLKRSFTVNLEFMKEDFNVEGYESLNFNNAFEDPTYMREVLYGILARRHTPAVRTNYIHLYLNDKDWGLYPNIQQINGEFIREWWFSNDGARWRADSPTGTPGGPGGPGGGGPGFGNGTAAINYLGADTSKYQQYYTLKKSEVSNPWDKLAQTANVLNQTALNDLETVLPQYLDIDRTLWFLATEIAFADDDSYVHKGAMDYYIYWDPETKRLCPIEVDGNSSLATSRTSWSPFYNEGNANFPLLNRLLAVPAWRQRYLAHLRNINETSINPAIAHPIIDRLAKKIDALAKTDPQALYGYSSFTTGISTLKNFFTNRYNYLKAQAEVSQVAPSISGTIYRVNKTEGQLPKAGESVQVRSKVSNAAGVTAVLLYYSNQLTGNFSKVQMKDDGNNDDGIAGDGIYGASVPAYNGGTYVRYYIEAISANAAKTASYDPTGAEHDVYFYQVQALQSSAATVVINEVVASNTKDLDENKQADDWIELYNTTNTRINLSGYFLTDNLTNLNKWTFPEGTFIEPKKFLIVWADEDQKQGPLHANFKLSKSGELLILSDPKGNQLDRAEFGEQQDDKGFARVPDGTGNFVIQKSSFNASNNLATSVRDLEQWGVKIYPNPAQEQVIIEAQQEISGKLLTVFNLQGQLITQQILQQKTTLNTNSWPNGTYLLRIGDAARRLVIMK